MQATARPAGECVCQRGRPPIAWGVAAAALAYLTRDVRTAGPVSRWEARVAINPTPAPDAAFLVTRGGSNSSALLMGILAAAIAVRNGNARTAWQLPLRVAAGMAARKAFADRVRRPRPPAAWWQETPTGWSFPSRHVTNATLGLAALADACQASRRRHAWRLALGLSGVVGWSRVRLGVHWPTDAVSGLLFAVLWSSAPERQQSVIMVAPGSVEQADCASRR
jgi:membrane-associated phospholipid phosphatase